MVGTSLKINANQIFLQEKRPLLRKHLLKNALYLLSSVPFVNMFYKICIIGL